MTITVHDKSYPQDLAIEINGECNHAGDVVFKEVLKWISGYPETFEVEVCERCEAAV